MDLADGEQRISRRADGTFDKGNANTWKPGQSGNPSGRRKGPSLSALAARLLDKDPELAMQIVRKWLGQAKGGDARALKELLDRTEGKVPERIAGVEGEPMTVVFRAAERPEEGDSGDSV